MGWGYGFVNDRDVGYGVPAECDHPRCHAEIDRGLAYCCGDEHGGGDRGCGLYFCAEHLAYYPQLCSRCRNRKPPFTPKPDVAEWIEWKLTDESWDQWRRENAEEVAELRKLVAA